MLPIGTENGVFVDGDPVTGAKGTRVTAAWLNSVQGEVLSVLAAVGIAPAAGNNQLLAAIQELIKRGINSQIFDFGSLSDPTPGDGDGFEHLDLGNLS